MLSTNNPFPDYIANYEESDDTENFANDEIFGCDEEINEPKESTLIAETGESMHIDETIPCDSDNDPDFLPESNSEKYSDTDQSEIWIDEEDSEEDESILKENLRGTNNLSVVKISREGNNLLYPRSEGFFL